MENYEFSAKRIVFEQKKNVFGRGNLRDAGWWGGGDRKIIFCLLFDAGKKIRGT